MTAARVAVAICEQVELMAGEFELKEAMYRELRETMDAIRAKVNAPETLADRDVVKLVQVVPRTEFREPPPAVLMAGQVSRG